MTAPAGHDAPTGGPVAAGGSAPGAGGVGAGDAAPGAAGVAAGDAAPGVDGVAAGDAAPGVDGVAAGPVAPPPAGPARRPRRRRALRALSALLIAAGALVVADGVATLLWQEPVTAVYARVQQDRLDDELRALEHAVPPPAERRAMAQLPDARRLGFAARALGRRSEPGDPLGRLRVPAIGLSSIVVEGTGGAELRSGPGHYPDTPLPGRRGTVAIAGHRTTYGAPFRRVDDLERGDRIELAMPYGRFTYSVERTRIVPPTAVDVVDRVAYDRLVLTACHPLYSANERIVVFARLDHFR